MHELKLGHLFRIALMPALAAGISLSSMANAPAGSQKAPDATTAKAASSSTYRAMRASTLIGTSVRSPRGENLGQIRDMIVNMNTGDVRYAVLEFDPGIFQGERLFAVPTTQLRMAPDRNDVVYEMSKAKLEQSAVKRADWDTAWRDPNYIARLDKVWGVQQPARGALAHRASDLIGKDVNSRTGEKIGEIEELVVNMANQKVHYAVLEFDPSWAAPDKNYLFPLRAFNLTADKDELVLDVDKAKIQAMKSFPDSFYANLNDRVALVDIDRYLVTVLPVVTTGNATRTSGASTADLFTRLDEDKNGWLNKAEVKDSADVDRNWTRFDKDGNNQISRDEFMRNYTIESESKR